MKRVSLLCGALAFAIYAYFAPPVSGDRDAAEFTISLAVLGVAHPTGYALFTMLGHGFVVAVHALGFSWAKSANLLSAFGGGIAIGLLHRLATKLCGSWKSALIPTALFAFNPVWTIEASFAEIHTFHLVWVCGAGLALTVLLQQPLRATSRRALHWGLLGGLALAHHATAVFCYLAMTAVLAAALRKVLRPRHVLLALCAATLPLVSWLYIVYRAYHPAIVQWPWLEPSLGSVWAHLSGKPYAANFGSYAPSPFQQQLLAKFMWGPLLVSAIATALWLERDRWLRGALAAGAIAFLAHAFSYGASDVSAYFLGPLALLSVSLAQLRKPLWAVPVIGLCALWSRELPLRKDGFIAFDQNLREMWGSIPFERAIVLFPDDMAWKLVELQVLERSKPGLEVVDTPMFSAPPYRERFARRWGFDPTQPGPTLPVTQAMKVSTSNDAWVTQLHAAIAARSPVPVIVFDPAQNSVRLLRR